MEFIKLLFGIQRNFQSRFIEDASSWDTPCVNINPIIEWDALKIPKEIQKWECDMTHSQLQELLRQIYVHENGDNWGKDESKYILESKWVLLALMNIPTIGESELTEILKTRDFDFTFPISKLTPKEINAFIIWMANFSPEVRKEILLLVDQQFPIEKFSPEELDAFMQIFLTLSPEISKEILSKVDVNYLLQFLVSRNNYSNKERVLVTKICQLDDSRVPQALRILYLTLYRDENPANRNIFKNWDHASSENIVNFLEDTSYYLSSDYRLEEFLPDFAKAKIIQGIFEKGYKKLNAVSVDRISAESAFFSISNEWKNRLIDEVIKNNKADIYYVFSRLVYSDAWKLWEEQRARLIKGLKPDDIKKISNDIDLSEDEILIILWNWEVDYDINISKQVLVWVTEKDLLAFSQWALEDIKNNDEISTPLEVFGYEYGEQWQARKDRWEIKATIITTNTNEGYKNFIISSWWKQTQIDTIIKDDGVLTIRMRGRDISGFFKLKPKPNEIEDIIKNLIYYANYLNKLDFEWILGTDNKIKFPLYWWYQGGDKFEAFIDYLQEDN